ncbi:hypothetical protein [Streptomyces sp. NPDC006270]|uniref:hypothetical protein n=1 Tax=Streptomyces sp. NPDC006270 TaxID=3364741 RepID=UPI00369F926A
MVPGAGRVDDLAGQDEFGGGRGARRSPADAGATVRRLPADAQEPGAVYGAA